MIVLREVYLTHICEKINEGKILLYFYQLFVWFWDNILTRRVKKMVVFVKRCDVFTVLDRDDEQVYAT